MYEEVLSNWCHNCYLEDLNYRVQPSDKGEQIKRSWAGNGNLFGEE